MRVLSTPEGTYVHDRGTGLCLFTSDVKSEVWNAPLYAQIALTEKCDRQCWFCYASSSPEGGSEFQVDELKDLIAFLDRWGVLGVAFGGGEPFLYPHLVDIVRWTWQNTGLDVSVTTNGTAASEDQIRGIEGFASEVRVSLYDARSLACLKKFVGRKFEVGANLLLFRGHVGKLEELVRGAMKLGVNDFLVNEFRAVGRGAARLDMEPTEADVEALATVVKKLRHRATFKTSTRLAGRLAKFFPENTFIPFQRELPGRIIAITADKRVKLSSLSDEGCPFTSPSEIPGIYRRLCGGETP